MCFKTSPLWWRCRSKTRWDINLYEHFWCPSRAEIATRRVWRVISPGKDLANAFRLLTVAYWEIKKKRTKKIAGRTCWLAIDVTVHGFCVKPSSWTSVSPYSGTSYFMLLLLLCSPNIHTHHIITIQRTNLLFNFNPATIDPPTFRLTITGPAYEYCTTRCHHFWRVYFVALWEVSFIERLSTIPRRPEILQRSSNFVLLFFLFIFFSERWRFWLCVATFL